MELWRTASKQARTRCSKSQSPVAEKAQKREKLPILFGLFVSNAIAIALAITTSRHWIGPFYIAHLITQNPTEVGIAVQVISYILGLILVSAIGKKRTCLMIKLLTDNSLKVLPSICQRVLSWQVEASSSNHLSLLNALCRNRVEWSTKHICVGYSIIFVAFNMLPAALWAGAITPAVTNAKQLYDLYVPDYSTPFGIHGSAFSNSSYTVVEPLGTFTFFPQIELSGLILSNAHDAISPSGGFSSHAKLNKTGYSYTTRSFGVASPVGLIDTFAISALAYQYREIGLKASTSCMYNESSLFGLESFDLPPEWGWSFQVYNAMGFLPNHASLEVAATSMTDNLAFALGAGSANSTEYHWTHYVALAAYWNASNSQYSLLNNVQCQVFFDSYEFLVSINTTSRSISVVP